MFNTLLDRREHIWGIILVRFSVHMYVYDDFANHEMYVKPILKIDRLLVSCFYSQLIKLTIIIVLFAILTGKPLAIERVYC